MKRIPSGGGRMYATILLKVWKPHDELLVLAEWRVESRSKHFSTFEYVCSNRYQGDDESIVNSLWGDLPVGLEGEHFEIDWENSVY